MINSHFEEVPVDEIVFLAESIAENTCRVAASNLVGRQEKVDALENVPQFLRKIGTIRE